MLSFSNIEDYLSFYCAPCLLGQKCANIFCMPLCMYSEDSELSESLARAGFTLRLLYISGDRGHLILYSSDALAKVLAKHRVREALRFFGYREESLGLQALSILFEKLEDFSNRKKEGNDVLFPHEIGLFLGYPAQDVLQYYLKKGQDYIFSGYWKVYSNPLWAASQFRKYDAARIYCINRHFRGYLLSCFAKKTLKK